MSARFGVCPIDDIEIKDRYRKDLGDLTELVASIKHFGSLLQPVVVNRNWKLVAGERRLRAARKAGLAEVPYVYLDQVDDLCKALRAEQDENGCRMPLKTSEKVALAKDLEVALRALARERQRQTRTQPGQKVGKAQRGVQQNTTLETGEKGKTRDKAAAAAGMSPATYHRASAVVNSAGKSPQHRSLLETMDKNGKVAQAFAELRKLEAKAAEAASSENNSKWPPGLRRRILAAESECRAIAGDVSKLATQAAPADRLAVAKLMLGAADLLVKAGLKVT